MKKIALKIIKFICKSILHLFLAIVILIGVNEMSESDWLDPYDGEFWKWLCSEKIALQVDGDKSIYENFRHEESRAISPNQDKIIIEYVMLDRNNFYYYDDTYLGGKNVIAVQKNDPESPNERYIYIGQESIRQPQWLDNDHVFFTADCGTHCETIYLLDVNTKELRVGNISSLVDTSYKGWQTIFSDWYGKKFVFSDKVNIVRSDIKNDQAILIFELGDGWNNTPMQKRFIFKNNSLLLQS